jgi:glycosyltransferase involved in cell wall biosynthesis
MAARRARPDIVTVLQSRKGKGNALAAGFARVTGDIVIMFDADGSADPAEITRFVEALTSGADFAKGTRFTAGGGSADITPVRRLGNRFLNGVFNVGFRTRYSDLCYGYNAFWADLIPLLELPDHSGPGPASGKMLWGDGFEIETVINCRFAAAKVSITEVPSEEKLRMFGESNLRAVQDGTRVLRTLFTEWRRARAMRRMERKMSEPALAKPAAVSDRIAA